MTTKELQAAIVENMKKWQKIETASVNSTDRIIKTTDNPIIRTVMEIIQRDSKIHHRIQEMIINSLEEKTIALSPDELGAIWDLVEKHIDLEKETVRLAREALEHLKGKKMVVQEYLLNYLRIDEEKHNEILDSLATIKKGMYPYG
jgi:hypothetical protein